MNTYYKLIEWQFDMERFAAALNSLHLHFSWAEIGDLIGTSPSAPRNWAQMNVSDEFPYPSMSNFLKVCNQLDLDVREFFVLGDE